MRQRSCGGTHICVSFPESPESGVSPRKCSIVAVERLVPLHLWIPFHADGLNVTARRLIERREVHAQVPDPACCSYCSRQPERARSASRRESLSGFSNAHRTGRSASTLPPSFSTIAARVSSVPGALVSGVFFSRLITRICCFPVQRQVSINYHFSFRAECVACYLLYIIRHRRLARLRWRRCFCRLLDVAGPPQAPKSSAKAQRNKLGDRWIKIPPRGSGGARCRGAGTAGSKSYSNRARPSAKEQV